MSFQRILDQYREARFDQPPADATRHFEEAAREAAPEEVSEGLAHAFRAEETPPFGQMVARLFRDSDRQQRSGLIERLREALGGEPGVSEDSDPREVEDLATKAEARNPNIIERVSRFYAQHPGLVRNLGGAALTIALARMAQRQRH